MDSRIKEARTANSGFAKAGVLCFFRKLFAIFVVWEYQESKC
jgi:hypothetical protein